MIDDMDEPEPCDQCRGGIVEECDRCLALADFDAEQDQLSRPVASEYIIFA
jgi:hypothetical protein